MAKESFILVNLNEPKAKKLAQAMSSDTAKKVLDFLAKREDATESEISDGLRLPLSTVHYNLQQLKESGLVKVEEFHYSQKGKEVDHYKVSNKMVIIVPESTPIEPLKQKLSSILPMALIAVLGSAAIHFFTKISSGSTEMAVAKSMARDAAPMLASAPEMFGSSVAREPNLAVWFLFGSLFMIAAYALFVVIKWELSKK